MATEAFLVPRLVVVQNPSFHHRLVTLHATLRELFGVTLRAEEFVVFWDETAGTNNRLAGEACETLLVPVLPAKFQPRGTGLDHLAAALAGFLEVFCVAFRAEYLVLEERELPVRLQGPPAHFALETGLVPVPVVQRRNIFGGGPNLPLTRFATIGVSISKL